LSERRIWLWDYKTCGICRTAVSKLQDNRALVISGKEIG